MPQQISAALARRVALAAQGFGRPASASVGTRQLTGLIERIQLLQIDSVNVFERSHYLPAFARLGGYDRAALDALTLGPRPRYLEYWAHEAAFIPRETWPLLRWRMAEYRDRGHWGASDWSESARPLLAELRAVLADRGPLAASEIEHESSVRRGPWWGWSDVKRGLELLFAQGEVTSAGRKGFERRYALTERVLPAELLAIEIPREDAIRELISRSARAHGIGTAKDLADYFRLPVADARRAIADLTDAGELVPVEVAGWRRGERALSAWLHRDARLPRRIEATAVLSPFDPIAWERDRLHRLFGMHYRIEIYTPAPKRVFGYYVLPILIDDRIVGRLDLKSDRQRGVLMVRSAWVEAGVAPDPVAERLLPQLERTAAWQGLSALEIADRGDLAPALRR